MKKVTIYQRKYKGKTIYGIRIPKANGKEVKKQIGLKRDAIEAAKVMQNEIDKSQGIKKKKKIISLNMLYDEFISRKRNLKESSIKRYKAYNDSFIRFIEPNFPNCIC